MANDIKNALNSTTTIKNGSAIVYCSKTGISKTLDTNAINTPIITDIDDKYDNRFYNGIFTTIIGSIDGNP